MNTGGLSALLRLELFLCRSCRSCGCFRCRSSGRNRCCRCYSCCRCRSGSRCNRYRYRLLIRLRISGIVDHLILEAVTDRLLAAWAVNKSVRIPCTVSEIVCVIVELVVAVFASAVELRIVLIISRYGERIDHTAVLNPGSSVNDRRRTARNRSLDRLLDRCCSCIEIKSAFQAEV